MPKLTSEERYAADAAKAARPAHELTMWAVTLLDPSGKYGSHKLFMAYGDTAEEAEAVAMKSRKGSLVSPEYPTRYHSGLHPASRKHLPPKPPEGWEPFAGGTFWTRCPRTVEALVKELRKLPTNTRVTQEEGAPTALDATTVEMYYDPSKLELTL